MQITIAQAYQYFIDSKEYLTGSELPEWYTDEWSGNDRLKEGGYFYCDRNAYIVIFDDEYYLGIENMEWRSKDLTEIENILFYNWVIPNELISLEV